MATFFTLVPPQLNYPLAHGQSSEQNKRKEQRQQDESPQEERREWPLSISEGEYTFDAWGGPTTHIGFGKFTCALEMPSIPAAVSNFIVRRVNPDEELEWKYEGVREKVDDFIENETEVGKQLFYLKFDTRLRTIASLFQDYTYSCVETLAVMTDRGVRPLISVTEVVCGGRSKIIYDIFDRENNRFGTFDYKTWEVIFPKEGGMYHVDEGVMPDLHDALTFRIAMSQIQVENNQRSADLGWIKEGENMRSVILSIERKEDKVLASVNFSSYGGVNQPVTLTAHLVEDAETGLFSYPVSQPLDIDTDIGHGTLRLRQ